jgi:hypothetical protein
MLPRFVFRKAYPNGTCYCGCGRELEDRTAFFALGHDARATHQVIRNHYGTVADFVTAHHDLAALTSKVTRLEVVVFPQGRERGPLFAHPRTEEQWRVMGQLVGELEAEGIPPTCPGAWALLLLARGLLDEKAKADRPVEAADSSA